MKVNVILENTFQLRNAFFPTTIKNTNSKVKLK